jgi:microcystin-dependent protein
MKPFAGATIPNGYALADGSSQLRAGQYAAAFACAGTTWGTVDGTHFNLPDLRGRSLVGKDNMGGAAANRVTNAISGITGTTLGAVGGSQSLTAHVHTVAVTDPGHNHTQNAHNHAITDPGHFHDLGGAQSAGPTTAGAGGTTVAIQSGSNLTSTTTTGITTNNTTPTNNANTTGITAGANSTGAGASENMPPTAIVNWMIRL